MAEQPTWELSIVVPTFQRREVVLATVRAMAHLEGARTFEVVVVVDGSTDGTAEALRAEPVAFPLTVVDQPNRGAAAARNHGAAVARGDILLFLDDDMEPDPGLVLEHLRHHALGADAVVGHIPLHPDSPPSVLRAGVGEWAERRRARLARADAPLQLGDMLTGQLSVSRATFSDLDGFDTRFTAGGTFGGEDLDFLYRLRCSSGQIVFSPRAISHQRYVVEPAQYLRQWYQAGEAERVFGDEHPRAWVEIATARGAERRLNRWVWRPLVRRPRLATPSRTVLRRLALWLAGGPSPRRHAHELFFRVRDLEYWAGVRAAEVQLGQRCIGVLAYHAVADDRDDGPLRAYAVPPSRFAAQLSTLITAGCTFITIDQLLAFVHGAWTPPKKALLLTFDDAYADLTTNVVPLLRAHGIPAVVFAVSGRVGGTNLWDRHVRTRSRRLLDAEGLRGLPNSVEVGAHSRTHLDLTRLGGPLLMGEVLGALDDFESLGLPRPRLFAYPYGEHDDRVERAVEVSGLEAAFALGDRVATRGDHSFVLPRIEILAGDTGHKLLRKAGVI